MRGVTNTAVPALERMAPNLTARDGPVPYGTRYGTHNLQTRRKQGVPGGTMPGTEGGLLSPSFLRSVPEFYIGGTVERPPHCHTRSNRTGWDEKKLGRGT